MADITIRFKKATPIEFEIDPDAITFGDAMELLKLQNASTEEEMVAITDIITRVVGQDAKTLPARHVKTIFEALVGFINTGNESEKN